MLIPLLAAMAALSSAHGTRPPEGEAVMADTAQDPNPYGLPFSREEYIAALALVWSRKEAEQRAGPLFTRDPDLIGITVMDGDYLLLSLVSDALAERMIAARPRLADLIRRVRADPQEFLRSFREQAAGNSP